MKIFVLFFVSMLFLSACNQHDQKEISFYHWKSKANMNSEYRKVLAKNKSKNIYIHYFDIKPTNGDVYPEYLLRHVDPEFKNYNIIPVVYIVNQVFTGDIDIKALAQKTTKLVNQISQKQFNKKIDRIQVDCDWTQKSMSAYFEFLKLLSAEIELLDDLENLYLKKNKSDYEKVLLSQSFDKEHENFLDIVTFNKGIYYLYERNLPQANFHFKKYRATEPDIELSARIFSNNIHECFECHEDEMMVDEVYKAEPYSFIEDRFSIRKLPRYLMNLENLTQSETAWKAKLANYLLGNYYFNVSNTGYYRGALTNKGNCCNYNYINYDDYKEVRVADKMIGKKSVYNLKDISAYGKTYYGFSEYALEYYYKTIELSKDKELNARCLYLIAKCELNDFYNNGSDDTFISDLSKYNTIELPNYKSFKVLEEEYSDTEFYDMIIGECSYFRMFIEQ